MVLSKYIDIQLNKYRDSSDGSLKIVDDDFILAYGPFMCMRLGMYERECDEISNYNKYMQVMLHAAYLIRKITSGITYRDAKKLFREFIMSIDTAFPTNKDLDLERETLATFAKNYLKVLRSEQQENGNLESFVTCVAPIVPYENTITKPMDDQHADIITDVRPSISDNLKEEIVHLLYSNLADIMLNYELCDILFDENLGDVNLLKLDKMVMRKENVSPATQKYYLLSTINYYKLNNHPGFKKYLDFFEDAGDFSKTKSFSAFESMIDTMASATDTNVAFEFWEDSYMAHKEELALQRLIQSSSIETAADNEAKYDFGMLNDFINVKRFMKFEEFPNRLFVGSIEGAKIVNITNMGDNRNYYELDNGTVVCPFLDLRDYRAKAIILYANTNEIKIIDNFQQMKM